MTLPHALPASRVPDPREAPSLRWGILGSGWIAERFVDAAQTQTRQQIAAVGSRSADTARAFADRFGIVRAHGSYEALVADPELDVIYVATPHNFHLPHARLALEAGKHVLIEKPITLNAGEARQLETLAAKRGLYCAEAMWSAYTPKFDVIRQVLDAGLLGEIASVIVDFGEWFDDDHRIMRPELAGGPMLDLGTYPFSLAHWVLRAPTDIVARGQNARTGVNGQLAAILVHAGGAQSVIHTSVLGNSPTGATIAGSAATLHIPGIYYRPGPFTVESSDRKRLLTYTEPEAMYTSLSYEAAETARRITAGETDTPYRPYADVLGTLEIMDEVRRQIGQVFAEER